MRIRFFVASLALSLLALGKPAPAEDAAIGFVKTLSGSVSLTRDGATETVRPATALHEKDRLETGADGTIGITLRDNTRIAIGPNSRIEIVHFVFKPAGKEYGFVLRVARGTLEYISGLIAKLAPDSIAIEMPTATIAVRGTRLLIRVKD